MTTHTKEVAKKESKDTRLEAEALPKVPAHSTYHEEADAIYVDIDLPGVRKEDVNLHLEGNILLLEGKSIPPSYEGFRILDASFAPCVYYRKFELGKDIDRNNIKAELKEGVLQLSLPKEEKTMRQIEVSKA